MTLTPFGQIPALAQNARGMAAGAINPFTTSFQNIPSNMNRMGIMFLKENLSLMPLYISLTLSLTTPQSLPLGSCSLPSLISLLPGSPGSCSCLPRAGWSGLCLPAAEPGCFSSCGRTYTGTGASLISGATRQEGRVCEKQVWVLVWGISCVVSSTYVDHGICLSVCH